MSFMVTGIGKVALRDEKLNYTSFASKDLMWVRQSDQKCAEDTTKVLRSFSEF